MSRSHTSYRYDRVHRGGRARRRRRLIELGVALVVLAACTAVFVLTG